MSSAHNKHSTLTNDAIWMAQWIHPTDLQLEYALQHTKWYEYRFITPLQATIKFLKAYNDAYRRAYVINIDRENGQNSVGYPLNKFLYGSDKATVWRARQLADKVGMRYEEYCAFAMDFAMRRKRKFIPQPNQFTFSEEAHQLWCEFRDRKWNECVAEGLIQPVSDPAYRLENFKDLPAQRDYRKWILERAASSNRPQDIMAIYSVRKAVIPREMFKDALPADIYEKAIARLEGDIRHDGIETEPMPLSTSDSLLQGCFGLPGAPEADILKELCGTCPLQKACAAFRTTVEAELVRQHGTVSPVIAKQKQGANERQRRRRAKLRAMNAAALSAPA